MNLIKSFEEFLNESFIFEAKKELKFDELDMPQRNDWTEKTIFSKWDAENGGELEKAKAELGKLKDPDEIAKAEKKVDDLTADITEKIKKDKKYGKKGQPKRDEWEQQFEAFRLGVLLEEARTKLGMTQEELAEKCGTNKSYISRIENNSSDIRLSTLMKIIQKGLGGQLKLTIQL